MWKAVAWLGARHTQAGRAALALALLRGGTSPDTSVASVAVAGAAAVAAVLAGPRLLPPSVCPRWADVPSIAAAIYWSASLVPAGALDGVANAAGWADPLLAVAEALAGVGLVVHAALALPTWANANERRTQTLVAASVLAGTAAMAAMAWSLVNAAGPLPVAWPVLGSAAAVWVLCAALVGFSEGGTVVDTVLLPAVPLFHLWMASRTSASPHVALAARLAVFGLQLLFRTNKGEDSAHDAVDDDDDHQRALWAATICVLASLARYTVQLVSGRPGPLNVQQNGRLVAAAAATLCQAFWAYDRLMNESERRSSFV